MAEIKTKTREKQPVVVLVGHIDHGKSSILDKIRDFKITQKETGGITQQTGTYEVEHQGKKITFIDTPGHEAFTAMRRRGAKVADIAVLVVAADEGVKPQTKEAISHLKEAKVPIIAAINKIDKTGADPERVKDELSANEVMPEDRGGNVPCVKTSATTGKGIDELLEMILLVAEVNQLEADFDAPAQGVVIESFLCSKRGCLATLLLAEGILKAGDIIATSSTLGKIKRIESFLGQELEEARPGQGVRVLGFEELPIMGDNFMVFASLEEAREHLEEKKEVLSAPPKPEEGQKLLNIILKTDFLGSIEPVKEVLGSLPQEKILLNILKAEAGDVSLSDIKLAETSNSLILGFRAEASVAVEETAKKRGVKITTYKLIYDLVEGVRDFMKKMLTVEKQRVDVGELKTLLIFKTDKRRQIIGAKVVSGEVRQGLRLEIIRDQEVVGAGKIVGLERDKKKLEKGKKGDEVGVLFEGSAKIEEGDILKAFEEVRQEKQL